MVNDCINAVEMDLARASHRSIIGQENPKVSSKAITVAVTKIEAQENFSQVDLVQPLPVRKLKLEARAESASFDGSLGPKTNTLLMRTSSRPYAVSYGGAVSELLAGGMTACTNTCLYPNLGVSGPDFGLRDDNALYDIQHPLEAFRLFPDQKGESSESLGADKGRETSLGFQERQAERFYYEPPVRSLLSHRRKLLILDINGLLADIVSPPPKDHKADVNIARRAGDVISKVLNMVISTG